MEFSQSDGEKVIAVHLLSSTAELMAGWHVLSGHFPFQEQFFVAKLPSIAKLQKNAAMAVLVARRWHRGTRLMRRTEFADVGRLMLSRLSILL